MVSWIYLAFVMGKLKEYHSASLMVALMAHHLDCESGKSLVHSKHLAHLMDGMMELLKESL